MQQYFAKNKNLELEDSDYNHIKKVMRMKKGDTIKVVYDKVIYKCKLTSVLDKVTFDVMEKEKTNDKEVNVTIAFALIKEQRLNYLLQKATEMGANCLIPIVTKRSVVKIDKNKEGAKLQRWQKICKEASEQSFSSYVPIVNSICDLNGLVDDKYDLKLLCSLNKNTKNIKKVLQKNNKCVKILLVVGPEGGFDPREEEFLIKNGFVSVSLGDKVLRAETAPVVALSMINYEFMR